MSFRNHISFILVETFWIIYIILQWFSWKDIKIVLRKGKEKKTTTKYSTLQCWFISLFLICHRLRRVWCYYRRIFLHIEYRNNYQYKIKLLMTQRMQVKLLMGLLSYSVLPSEGVALFLILFWILVVQQTFNCQSCLITSPS